MQLGLTPSSDYWYLALNEARGPWSDVRVRQAIAMTAPRKQAMRGGAFLRRRIAEAAAAGGRWHAARGTAMTGPRAAFRILKKTAGPTVTKALSPCA